MSRPRQLGQGVAEFAIALPLFIVFVVGVLDLGLAIYRLNGTSQAAREIARATSVHPCTDATACVLGDTPEVQAVIATQKNLVPNLSNPTFKCVRPDGSVISGSGSGCSPGYSVRVTVVARYKPVTPLLGLFGTFDLQSSSTIRIQ
jgi:Flp pilus assembly protein TadG